MMAMTLDDHSGSDHILGSAVSRLETLIDQETAALRHATATELKDFNNRKAQALVELNRAVACNVGYTPSPDMRLRLRSVRDKLEINRRALKMHLDAVQEVAGMLADQIREADSDGTYTTGIRQYGKQL